jgi:ABC-type phosphate transport system substrate-binding protein
MRLDERVMRSHQAFCSYCGYDANPSTATSCEICSEPLFSEGQQRTPAQPRLGRLLPWLIALAAFLLLGSGLLFLRRPVAELLNQADAPRDLSEGLRLRESMRAVPNVPSGLFSYGGAFLFSALTAHGMNAEIAKAHPQFQLTYTEPINQNPGSGTGIQMLLDKQLSFAHSGRPLKNKELEEAASRGYRLEEIPVALDGIAFYTHPDLPIQGLSITQVQAIFTGKLTNWLAVGGPDLPIIPVSVEPKVTSSFLMLFAGKEDAKPAPNLKIFRDYTACLRAVASTPGAISYGSSPLIVSQRSIHPIALSRGNAKEYVSPVLKYRANTEAFRNGSYPLTRRLFVIIRRDGSLDEQAGIAYSSLLLSKQGQQIIQDSGFVPLRPSSADR